MTKFIGYTIGLEANRKSVVGKMVKVEYKTGRDGAVKLQAVSGHNLSNLPGHAAITAERFENRPQDPYDSVVEARWALNHCGWSLVDD